MYAYEITPIWQDPMMVKMARQAIRRNRPIKIDGDMVKCCGSGCTKVIYRESARKIRYGTKMKNFCPECHARHMMMKRYQEPVA